MSHGYGKPVHKKSEAQKGVKSDSSRLSQSDPGNGDGLITLSCLPHTLTAGGGRSRQSLDADSTTS